MKQYKKVFFRLFGLVVALVSPDTSAGNLARSVSRAVDLPSLRRLEDVPTGKVRVGKMKMPKGEVTARFKTTSKGAAVAKFDVPAEGVTSAKRFKIEEPSAGETRVLVREAIGEPGGQKPTYRQASDVEIGEARGLMLEAARMDLPEGHVVPTRSLGVEERFGDVVSYKRIGERDIEVRLADGRTIIKKKGGVKIEDAQGNMRKLNETEAAEFTKGLETSGTIEPAGPGFATSNKGQMLFQGAMPFGFTLAGIIPAFTAQLVMDSQAEMEEKYRKAAVERALPIPGEEDKLYDPADPMSPGTIYVKETGLKAPGPLVYNPDLGTITNMSTYVVRLTKEVGIKKAKDVPGEADKIYDATGKVYNKNTGINMQNLTYDVSSGKLFDMQQGAKLTPAAIAKMPAVTGKEQWVYDAQTGQAYDKATGGTIPNWIYDRVSELLLNVMTGAKERPATGELFDPSTGKWTNPALVDKAKILPDLPGMDGFGYDTVGKVYDKTTGEEAGMKYDAKSNRLIDMASGKQYAFANGAWEPFEQVPEQPVAQVPSQPAQPVAQAVAQPAQEVSPQVSVQQLQQQAAMQGGAPALSQPAPVTTPAQEQATVAPAQAQAPVAW